MWYISDLEKFKSHYPKWRQKYNTKKIIEELIKPVNLCYAVSAKTERVQAQVHTTLLDHIKLSTTDNKPSVELLYQKLTQAFVASGLY